MQSKYAALQAMAALTVYTMPIVSCVAMGADQYTYMWTGRALPLLALAVPPLILVVYVLQRRMPPRHELACLLGIVPGALFFLVGVAIMYFSVRYADRLRTSECAELGGVEDLVAYAKEAVEFHAKCTEGLPVNQTTLLPACPGYDDLMADNPDREEAWLTLANMERDFFCGAFPRGDAPALDAVLHQGGAVQHPDRKQALVVHPFKRTAAGAVFGFRIDPLHHVDRFPLGRDQSAWPRRTCLT